MYMSTPFFLFLSSCKTWNATDCQQLCVFVREWKKHPSSFTRAQIKRIFPNGIAHQVYVLHLLRNVCVSVQFIYENRFIRRAFTTKRFYLLCARALNNYTLNFIVIAFFAEQRWNIFIALCTHTHKIRELVEFKHFSRIKTISIVFI